MGCAGSKGVPDGDASKGRTEQSPVSPPATASRPEELSQVAQAAEVANDAGSGRLQTVSPVISVAPVGTGEVKVTSDDDRADGVDVQRAEEPETPQSQGSESPRPFYEEQEQENRNAEPSEHGSDAFQSPQNENMKAALQPGTTRAPEEPDAEVLAHRSSFTPLTSAAESHAQGIGAAELVVMDDVDDSALGQSFVLPWLENIGLGAYAAAFARAGFDERDVLAALESKDLEEIQRFSGVKILPGHRKKILLHVARLRDEGGATQAGDQAGGPRGGWEVGGEGTKRGAEDTGGATERGEARATTEERRSGQEGGRRPEEMDRHENGEDAADSGMAFVRIRNPGTPEPITPPISAQKRPRSSQHALELELLAADVSAVSVGSSAFPEEAGRQFRVRGTWQPLPAGRDEPRGQRKPHGASYSHVHRAVGGGGGAPQKRSTVTGAVARQPSSRRANTVYPVGADRREWGAVSVAEVPSPPAQRAPAVWRAVSARELGAIGAGWGAGHIQLANNVPLDAAGLRKAFRRTQGQIEALVARRLREVRRRGAQGLTSLDLIRMARESKAVADTRRDAIALEMVMQRRVDECLRTVRSRAVPLQQQGVVW